MYDRKPFKMHTPLSQQIVPATSKKTGSASDYVFGSRLGKGSFGVVFKVTKKCKFINLIQLLAD